MLDPTLSDWLDRQADALEAASGGDPFALEAVDTALHHALAHHGSARVAISAALHDLVGKRLGVPVIVMIYFGARRRV